MAHQIFGETERIFGYQDLRIHLYYTAGSLQIYFNYVFTKKMEDKENNVIPDNITEQVNAILPDNCSHYTNLTEFYSAIDKDKEFRPLGEQIRSFDITEENITRTFVVFKMDFDSKKNENYFLRLQTFILWFVDKACYIDVDDPYWYTFLIFEKFKDSEGNTRYAFAGYSSIYQYYAYPEHIRPRVSQFLILPPFQNMGIGTTLLETINQYYAPLKNVVDITVELPSSNFTRMRNYVDTKSCKTLPSFSAENLRKGFDKTMIEEAKRVFKINKIQCRIIYEILRLYHTNINNEIEYKNYRLDVKKRLSVAYLKAKNDIKKMESKGFDATQAKALLPSNDERMEQLKTDYTLIEESYLKTIQRIRLDE